MNLGFRVTIVFLAGVSDQNRIARLWIIKQVEHTGELEQFIFKDPVHVEIIAVSRASNFWIGDADAHTVLRGHSRVSNLAPLADHDEGADRVVAAIIDDQLLVLIINMTKV